MSNYELPAHTCYETYIRTLEQNTNKTIDPTRLFNELARDHVEEVARLIDNGISVDTKNSRGLTPLMLTVKYGYIKTIRLLLNKGAHVNFADSNNWTSLMWASYLGCYDIARVLLENGADVNVTSLYGNTAELLAKQGGYTGIVGLIHQYHERRQNGNI